MCPCWHYGVGFFLSDIYKAIYHLSVLRNEYFLKKFLQDQCICYAVDILACKTQMNEDLQPLLSSLLQLLLQVKLCCLYVMPDSLLNLLNPFYLYIKFGQINVWSYSTSDQKTQVFPFYMYPCPDQSWFREVVSDLFSLIIVSAIYR